MRVATASHIEAIVMRLSRTADELVNGLYHQGPRERLIEHTEQAVIVRRGAVCGH